MKELSINVGFCARCGENHSSLKFLPFTRPVIEQDKTLYTHFGVCPKSNEPILLSIEG